MRRPRSFLAIFVCVGTLAASCRSGGPPPRSCRGWQRESVPGANDGIFTGVLALDAGDVWLAGTGAEPFHTQVEHWDGSTWEVTETPRLASEINHLNGLGGIKSDDLWATGIAYPGTSSHNSHPLVQHWDGTDWTAVETPPLETDRGALGAVAAIASDDVWAVGWAGSQGSQGSLIEHWDGKRWTIVSSPKGGEGFAALNSISAVSRDDVWAAGVDQGGGAHAAIVLHWDGASWKRVAVESLVGDETMPFGGPILHGVVALGRDDVWLAATQQIATGPAGAASTPLFVHWDGDTWSSMEGDVPGKGWVQLNGIGGGHDAGLWAVGSVRPEDGVGQPIVYGLEDRGWTVAASPEIEPAPRHMDDFRKNELFAVSVAGSGEAWAVGTYFTSSSEGELPLVERYCPPT